MELSRCLRGFGAMLVFLSLGCSAVGGPTPAPRTLPPLASLPEDPCEVLTIEQVSAVTGLQVTDKRRVPSIQEIVQAQKENRAVGPGTICSYETRSEFGAIAFSVASGAKANTARYREARDAYFRDFPGSAQTVPGLGEDAWIGGGTTLHVLVRKGISFTISTQMHGAGSRELMVRLASTVLSRLSS